MSPKKTFAFNWALLEKGFEKRLLVFIGIVVVDVVVAIGIVVVDVVAAVGIGVGVGVDVGEIFIPIRMLQCAQIRTTDVETFLSEFKTRNSKCSKCVVDGVLLF